MIVIILTSKKMCRQPGSHKTDVLHYRVAELPSSVQYSVLCSNS
jgi:hypothetical protein